MSEEEEDVQRQQATAACRGYSRGYGGTPVLTVPAVWSVTTSNGLHYFLLCIDDIYVPPTMVRTAHDWAGKAGDE